MMHELWGVGLPSGLWADEHGECHGMLYLVMIEGVITIPEESRH